MSEITKDFVFKSFPNDRAKTVLGKVNSQTEELEPMKVAKILTNSRLHSENDCHEQFELKIISNLIPSPGPSLLWCQDKLVSVADACEYIEDSGLPAILKVVGGCSLLGLNKNDKFLAFAHGTETRRFCEEYGTGRCYTICCESRTFYELNTEKARRQVPNCCGYPTEPFLEGTQDGREYAARERKRKGLKSLRAKKHGTKYSSKFIAAIGIENDLLVSTPFIISEDLCLSFTIAVGIEGCNSEQWTEYCTAHRRTTRQSSMRHFIRDKEMANEKLYLDLIELNELDNLPSAKNSDVISFYLDNYVISPTSSEFSSMTSRSDESAIVGLNKNQQQPLTLHITPSSRSTSSSILHSARQGLSPMSRDVSSSHSRRPHPMMGTSVFKTTPEKVNFDSNIIDDSPNNVNVQPTSQPIGNVSKLSNPVKQSSTTDSHKSSSRITKVPQSSSSLPHEGRPLSPSWTLLSSASSPSNLKVSLSKIKDDSNHDAISDEGYYTKSDVGVQF